jgi:hypothetical protein
VNAQHTGSPHSSAARSNAASATSSPGVRISSRAAIELPDGLVYCVYYEEGKGSSIRGVRLRVDTKGVTVVGKKG